MSKIFICAVLCLSQAFSAQRSDFHFRVKLKGVQLQDLFDQLKASKTTEDFFQRIKVDSDAIKSFPSYQLYKHANLKLLKVRKVNSSKFILSMDKSKPVVFEKLGSSFFLNGKQVSKRDLKSEQTFCAKFKICQGSKEQSLFQLILLPNAEAALVSALIAVIGFGLLSVSVATSTHPMAQGMAAITGEDCIMPIQNLLKKLDGKYRSVSAFRRAFNREKKKLSPAHCRGAKIERAKVMKRLKRPDGNPQ